MDGMPQLNSPRSMVPGQQMATQQQRAAGEDHYHIFARFYLFVLLENSARSRYRPLGGASLRSATVPSGCGFLQMSKT
jgi:hypothetical protein